MLFLLAAQQPQAAVALASYPAAPAQPAPFSAADFAARFCALLVQPWFSLAALSNGGLVYALSQGLGVGLSTIYGELAYVQLQTRLATATDTNLDQASLDFFGGGLPRGPAESDASFSARIRAQLISPQPTIAGIQTAVRSYYAVNAQGLQGQLLGLGTQGGLGTRGALGGVSSTTPIVPKTITVFDAQSNPTLAARVGITPPQFCILLSYDGFSTGDGLFLGRSHVRRESHLLTTKISVIAPPTSAVDAYVRQIKAAGTVPVWATNQQ